MTLPKIAAVDPIVIPEVQKDAVICNVVKIPTFVWNWADSATGTASVQAELIFVAEDVDGHITNVAPVSKHLNIADVFALAEVNPMAAQILGGLVVLLGSLYTLAASDPETAEKIGVSIT